MIGYRTIARACTLGSGVAPLRVMIDMIEPKGLPELVQHFAYRESSHRHKGAARHIIGKVRLYSSQMPWSGERGVLLVQIISTCLCDT